MVSALLVVDTSTSSKRYFSWAYGPVEEGVLTFKTLIKNLRRLKIDSILVNMGEEHTLPELKNASKPAIEFYKEFPNAFTNGKLVKYLAERSIDSLIIGGYLRHLCVLETIKGAKNLGINVITTNQIMFGYSVTLDGQEDRYNLEKHKSALGYFSRNTRFVDDIGKVLTLVSK